MSVRIDECCGDDQDGHGHGESCRGLADNALTADQTLRCTAVHMASDLLDNYNTETLLKSAAAIFAFLHGAE